MAKLKLGVFAHPNSKVYLRQKEMSKSIYKNALHLLERWEDGCFYGMDEEWVYKSLYEPFEPSPIDRTGRLQKNITTLKAVINCREHSCCRRQSYCIDCLANWRYAKAKAIMEAASENPNLRLLFRSETVILPRGVYIDPESKELRLITTKQINPVYSLPTGSKNHPHRITRVVEDGRLSDFRHNSECVTDQYDQINEKIWKLIGGVGISEDHYFIDLSRRLDDEKRARMQGSMLNKYNTLKKNIQAGISDREKNAIIPELLAHATVITKPLRNSLGYIHRVITVPSCKNNSVVLVRLDSMILQDRDTYIKFKETSPYWETDKRYRQYTLNGEPTYNWFYGVKTTTSCRVIPKDIHALLELLEKRFPFTGHLYSKFLPEEFLFYMNCMSEYRMIRCGGVFQESKCSQL